MYVWLISLKMKLFKGNLHSDNKIIVIDGKLLEIVPKFKILV